MLRSLREIVSAQAFGGDLLKNDIDFSGRIAMLSIEFSALQYTAARAEVQDLVVSIAASDLLRRLAGLGIDVLGIYATPDQASLRAGDNAYPVGPDGAARIISDYIELSGLDDASLLRDQLSSLIMSDDEIGM